MSNKADQDYWRDEYAGYRFHIAKPRDFIRRWIEKHVPSAGNQQKSCLEIGCYPGRFIAVFGELGYVLSGIDLVETLEDLPRWLAASGYRTGRFHKTDFTRHDLQNTYDVVCSFGFIEHFTNWESVLEQHLALVAEHGYLVVEAPNFVGAFQHWLHSNYDQENLSRHHLPAMQVERWAQIIEQAGFDIIDCGYFGRFRFWTEQQPRSIGQRAVLRALKIAQPVLRRLLPPDRKAYSPFAGVVARRRG